ncbi:hypothetical protein ASC94_09265 [Massilia sp. Root418]|uniref:hypothetical protein n=1 Tax=Massilia sp. Root418 TaxID=1736532 RepID=UPI0006FBE8E7|nr:hypothetical protein [Massilia sp. Root418]KQW96986.1 hypothetical protein ASC94_09265 [Massilia sp. Root418]
MAVVFSIIQGLAALYVLCVGLGALNRMGGNTQLVVRWSYIALTAGALAALVSCFYSRDLFECLFALGVAAHFAFNRRKFRSHA